MIDADHCLLGAAPSKHTHARPIFGVLGTIDLLAGTYLLVITRAQNIGSLHGSYVFRVLAADILPVHTESTVSSNELSDESEYVTLLRAVISGGTFYFSYENDLTSNCQRRSMTDGKAPLCVRADDQFFFNRGVQSALIAAGALDYVLPVIQGCIRALSDLLVNSLNLFLASLTPVPQLCRSTSIAPLAASSATHWSRVDRDSVPARATTSAAWTRRAMQPTLSKPNKSSKLRITCRRCCRRGTYPTCPSSLQIHAC
jgi:hypothetical protein